MCPNEVASFTQYRLCEPQQFSNRCCVSPLLHVTFDCDEPSSTVYSSRRSRRRRGFSTFRYVVKSDCGGEQRRNLLRLTAKSTQFGKKTFTSWLIESAGTLPLQRRKDFPDGHVDNSEVMLKLLEVGFIDAYKLQSSIFVQALEHGDAVCLFPEGMSRYHPTIAPLKTGGKPAIIPYHRVSSTDRIGNLVARLVSDVLSRNRYNSNFEVSVLTCSITYM